MFQIQEFLGGTDSQSSAKQSDCLKLHQDLASTQAQVQVTAFLTQAAMPSKNALFKGVFAYGEK